MHVIVYANEGMDQGYVYLTRELGDDEELDERTFADQVASMLDREIDESDGYIPDCCGDIRVEFLDGAPAIERDERNDCDRYQGSVCIWSGESYYFKRD